MHRGGLLLAVLAAVGILSTAPQVQAKGEYRVRITGPGLSEPVAVRGVDWPQVAGFYNQVGPQVPPEGTSLGPRYLARLFGGGDALIQHLYPYAEGGPYIYTPPRQPYPGAPHGWNHTGTDLLDVLFRAGLPRSAPAVSSGVDQPSTPSGPSAEAWIVLVAALGVAVSLLLRWKAPGPLAR